MPETISPLAGKPVEPSRLANIPRLMTAYFAGKPDPSEPAQRVAFGTSGHRGSALDNAFNEDHILAISQAICDYRQGKGIDGPLYLGMDTHALSEAAFASAIEVFAANGVETMIDAHHGYTPDPSHLPRHPDLQQGTQERSGRWSGDHPLAQPARSMAASNIIPPMAARPDRTSPTGSRTRPMRASKTDWRTSSARRSSGRSSRHISTNTTMSAPMFVI